MAERSAAVGAPGAPRWPSVGVPNAVPDAEAALRAMAALEASLLYLHGAHRLARHCERTDHLADMRREAEREYEYQVGAIEAVIRTVLASLELPEATELHGLEIASRELRRYAEGSVT